MMILMREILQLKLYVSQPRFVLLLLVCFLLVEGCRASQNSSNGSNSVIPPDTIVTQLQITPATSSLPVGFGEHLKAEVTLSDSTTLDVTADDAISWSSSNPAIATISGSGVNKGMLTGVAAGTVTITASGEANGQVFSSTAEVTVTNAIVTQLQITPATSSLPVGFGEHLKAEVTLSDSTTLDVTADDAISWSSSNPAIATISGSGV
ncbi:Ig-like domain-containing protein, partial [Aeromonas hydrophila]|uniref:Ig-like domain-containing protein n=1 Tax=Aeromonas hydrophila TaxID=644 RepID=UPI001364A2AC